MRDPEYLGDAVYVQSPPYDLSTIILTTTSHLLPNADNTIYLEAQVVLNLVRWLFERFPDLKNEI